MEAPTNLGQVLGAESVGEQGLDIVAVQVVAAIEVGELDDDSNTRDCAARALDELYGGGQRTAGRDEVIDDQDPVTRLNRVYMDFDRVGAVLELVADRGGLVGQFALLAGGTSGMPSLYARGEANRKPRASIPTMESRLASANRSAIRSTANLNAGGW